MTAFTTDYPHIRADLACPFCHKPKDDGLLCCWPCFRGEGLRYGESDAQRAVLEAREAKLTILAKHPAPDGWSVAGGPTDQHDYGPTIGVGAMARPTHPHPDSLVGRKERGR